MTINERLAELNGIDVKETEIPEVTREERTEAQALFTAIMTDTLLEEDIL